MTPETLKAFISQPLTLLGLMFLSALISAAKQLVVAQRQNAEVSVVDYFLKVETLIMIGAVFFAWIGLLMLDQLTWVAALGSGYIANDTADAWTKQGRSAVLSDTQNRGSK